MTVPDTKENMDKCICKDCPTYNQCMRDSTEGLFCAKGKSDCDVEDDDCVCEQCPVDNKYKLTAVLDLMEKKILKMNQFYCMKGPAGKK